MKDGAGIQREAKRRKSTLPLRCTVILSSDVYGDEEFKYGTDEELLAAVGRLFEEGKKWARKDGIERDIIVRIEPQTTRRRGN
jgi:hypothetical protein